MTSHLQACAFQQRFRWTLHFLAVILPSSGVRVLSTGTYATRQSVSTKPVVSIPSTDFDTRTWLLQPGLGWGTSPVFNEYTTPLCFHDRTARFDGIVEAIPAKEPLTRQEVSYLSNNQLKLAISSRGTTAGAGGALASAVQSLLPHSNGELRSGYELLHVQYNVPIKRYTIVNPEKACQTGPIKQLRAMIDNDQMEDEVMTSFIRTHGTQVVHSVILGGQLDLFHVRKSRGAEFDIVSKINASVAMSSSDMHLTVLGGVWNVTESRDSKTLLDAVNNWLISVQEENHLAVLKQHSMPLQLFIPPKLAHIVTFHSRNAVQQWQTEMSRAEKLQISGKNMVPWQYAYGQAWDKRDQLEQLVFVANAVPDFCNLCIEQSNAYNYGFVGLHVSPPADCVRNCLDQYLWVCTAAIPEQRHKYASDPKIESAELVIFYRRSQPKVTRKLASLTRNVCNALKPLFLSGYEEGMDKHAARSRIAVTSSSLGGVANSSQTEALEPLGALPGSSVSRPAGGLGWAVLPTSEQYTVPLCADRLGRLQGVVEAPANEAMRPIIRIYKHDIELKFAAFDSNIGIFDVGGSIGGAVQALLSKTGGKLQEGYKLLHVQYYVPISTQSISDPFNTCQNPELAALTKLYDAGALGEREIDRFLLLRGTRLATSVMLGGRLNLFRLAKNSDVGLNFFHNTLDASTNLMERNINLHVVGGQWRPMGSLMESVRSWVASIHASESLAVLSHATMPIMALLPVRLHKVMKPRIEVMTSGWLHGIFLHEYITFLGDQIRNKKEYFLNHNERRDQGLMVFRDILRSLGDFCVAADRFVSLQERGFVGMIEGASGPIAAQRCSDYMYWLCEEDPLELRKSSSRSHWRNQLLHHTRALCATRGM